VAFKTFVDGVALPASDLNTYLMKQAVIVCTSATRPASPLEGQQIYETDTDRMLTYTTATTTWRQPWNMPWGYITKSTSNSTTTGITTEVDVLTVTWTAVANRRYKISLLMHLMQMTNIATPMVAITDNSLTHIQEWQQYAGPAERFVVHAFVEVSPSSGSVTYRGRVATSNDTINLNGQTTTRLHYMLVEDMGPAGAPA
jgi:hypothetical protein